MQKTILQKFFRFKKCLAARTQLRWEIMCKLFKTLEWNAFTTGFAIILKYGIRIEKCIKQHAIFWLTFGILGNLVSVPHVDIHRYYPQFKWNGWTASGQRFNLHSAYTLSVSHALFVRWLVPFPMPLHIPYLCCWYTVFFLCVFFPRTLSPSFNLLRCLSPSFRSQ